MREPWGAYGSLQTQGGDAAQGDRRPGRRFQHPSRGRGYGHSAQHATRGAVREVGLSF
nr:MAG TPA: hypothetical protein [Caudoviricetes sp.]